MFHKEQMPSLAAIEMKLAIPTGGSEMYSAKQMML
jgi:hypothetical protein